MSVPAPNDAVLALEGVLGAEQTREIVGLFLSEAAKTLENAVLLVPGDSTINEHLGDAYWKIGRKLDAHFQWSHALAFGPDPDQKVKLEDKLEHGLDAGGTPS